MDDRIGNQQEQADSCPEKDAEWLAFRYLANELGDDEYLDFEARLADDEGNIGYQMSGLMPKRRTGVSGFTPLPGWESGNDWQGFLPVADLTRSLNPEEGYIVTANNDATEFVRIENRLPIVIVAVRHSWSVFGLSQQTSQCPDF